jgi:hypothetical protein
MIQISEEEINSISNDSDLGKYVREKLNKELIVITTNIRSDVTIHGINYVYDYV